ncbi:MAG: hypothetical protein Kow0010_03130 [Dehalococcoidia bacterium]
MNAEALPYTLYVILLEFAVGGLWITLYADLRGNGVTRGFVMTMAFIVAIVGGLAWLTGSGITIGQDIDGYPIDGGWFSPTQDAMVAVAAAAVVYTFGVFMGWDPVGRIAGIAGAVAGLFAVGTLAALLAPPTWGYPGAFIALFAGTLAMGSVSTAMTWGHWYLTEGSLPHKPMRDLAWVFFGSLALQTVVLIINATAPERITPVPSNPIEVGLLANPAFFFRVAVGIVFAFVLAIMAIRTTRIGSMQSTTGLLYIAMGAVFTGEVLSKGLQFLTAKPV